MASNGDRRTRINVKTAAEWTSANPVLQAGELGYESDTGKLKVGNGASSWGALSYTSATTDTSSATNFTSTLQVNGSDVTTDADIGSTIQAYDANLTGFVAACNLPTSDGSANQVLQTDGAGTISFATQSGGSLSDQGVTASAAELNVLDGMTATTAELNVLDGITATTAELNYMDGVTSNVQTQLDSKQAADTNLSSFLSAVDLPTSDGTNGQVLTTDGAGNITWSSASGGSGAESDPNNVYGYVQLSDGSGGFDYVADSQTTYMKYNPTDKTLQTYGLDSASLRYSDSGNAGLSNTSRAPSIMITYWTGYTKSTDTLLGFGGQVNGSVKTKYAQAYGMWWWPGADDTGAKGIDLATYGGEMLGLGKVNRRHTMVSVSGAGTVEFDANYGYNFIVNQPGGDFTCNFRNMKDESDSQAPSPGSYSTGRWFTTGTSDGDQSRAITVEIMIIQGSTAYMPTAVQIDGTAHTITWEGNSAPSGTANGKDIVYFDMYKIGTFASHTIHVLGRSKSFGGV